MALGSNLTISTIVLVLSIAYLSWALSLFFIINKGDSILAVLKYIWGYPLVCVISSLCGYPCHNSVSIKIHLKPLTIYTIWAWPPCPFFASTGLEVQPSHGCGIASWRGSDLRVSYLSVLHTHGFWTRFTQEKYKYWLCKVKRPTWLQVSKKISQKLPFSRKQEDCGNFDKLCFIWPFQNKYSSQKTSIINLKWPSVTMQLS